MAVGLPSLAAGFALVNWRGRATEQINGLRIELTAEVLRGDARQEVVNNLLPRLARIETLLDLIYRDMSKGSGKISPE